MIILSLSLTMSRRIYFYSVTHDLKELRNCNRKLILCRHKNKWKDNQYSKLLFFKITLHFCTHQTKYLHRKTKFLFHKQYVFDLLLPRNAKTAHTTNFYSFWKETSHKPLKLAAAMKFFPSVRTIVQIASMNVF